MKRMIGIIAATVVAIAPGAAFAVPGNSQGSTNGAGWTHSNGPPPDQTGQPNQSCQLIGTYPGNAFDAPGSAFNEDPGGTAGGMYAGSQPQNMRNSVSVSQYDVACANQPN